jgi:two-component system alkaline phosphatase synthesis response regulator PhoP
MSRVLIVEDEQHLADGLRFNLEAEGYHVEIKADGESALKSLTTGADHYDAIVLDVMLPGIDGFSVAAELRRREQFVPIMMLTARGRPEDILKGFESGADDYIPKPFELAILVARLKSLIRRTRWHQQRATAVESSQDAEPSSEEIDLFVFNDKTIDFASLELRTPDRTINLTLMEAELLRFLVLRAGRVVSRKSILEEVWNLNEETDTRAIDNFIVRLRRYIEKDPAKPEHLLTVRSVGYRFVPNP